MHEPGEATIADRNGMLPDQRWCGEGVGSGCMTGSTLWAKHADSIIGNSKESPNEARRMYNTARYKMDRATCSTGLRS